MINSAKYGSLQSTEEEAILETKDAEKHELVAAQKDGHLMSQISIAAILSTALTYGCIMTTLFILTLPIECQRIEVESTQYHHYTIRKSMALGGFAAIAGMTQLITPILGMMSDSYIPYGPFKTWGKRLPYLMFGTLLVLIGMGGQFWASNPIHQLQVSSTSVGLSPKTAILGGAWVEYAVYFTISMIGLNVVYTVMIAFIPDLVPHSQTGMANGALALMVVCGSLFGFGMFYLVLDESILGMYKMYGVLSFFTGCLTFVYVCDRETSLHEQKDRTYYVEKETNETQNVSESDTLNKEEKKETEKSLSDEQISIFHIPQLIVNLFYEPIKNKTQSELLAAYWIDVSEHHDFFVVTISRFFYYMAISSQTFFLYFIHDALRQSSGTKDPEAAVALLAMVGQTAGAVTCYPIGIISDQYFGSRRKPFVFFACFCLGMGNIALLSCTTLQQMIWVCILLGAANGMYLTMDTSLAVDTLEVDVEDEQKHDEETSGGGGEKSLHSHDGAAQLLGVWGVFGFIGSALGPLIGGMTLLVLGKKDAGPTQFYSIRGYEGVFLLSAFYFLCSSLSLLFVRKKGV